MNDQLAHVGLRHGPAVSLSELACRLGLTQGAFLTKIEHSDDRRVSTLRQYLEAGNDLDVIALVDDEVRRVPNPLRTRRCALIALSAACQHDSRPPHWHIRSGRQIADVAWSCRGRRRDPDDLRAGARERRRTARLRSGDRAALRTPQRPFTVDYAEARRGIAIETETRDAVRATTPRCQVPPRPTYGAPCRGARSNRRFVDPPATASS